MFYENYDAKILSVVPRKVERNDTIREFCSLTLCYEYTPQFAGAMGEFAEQLQAALCSGRLYSARLPVPKEEIVANFSDGPESKITIKRIDTVAAFLKRPNAEDPNPTLTAVMNFHADNEQFIWLKDRLNAAVEVNLDKVQGSLFDGEAQKKGGKRNA